MKYFESPSPCVCMFDVSDIEVKWPFASFSCLHSIVLNSILCNGYFPSYSLSLCLFLSSFFLVRAIIVHTRDVKCGDDAFSMRWFCFLSLPLQLLSLIVFHTNWLKYEYSFHWLSFRFLSSMDGPGWHGSESKLVRLMNVVEQSDKKPSVLTQWQGKDESNKNEIYMRHDTQLFSLSRTFSLCHCMPVSLCHHIQWSWNSETKKLFTLTTTTSHAAWATVVIHCLLLYTQSLILSSHFIRLCAVDIRWFEIINIHAYEV